MSEDEKTKRRHVGSYSLGATIGRGAFGKVKLGTDIFTGEKVAVKIIKYSNVKTKRERKQIERETNILLKLKHPNIVNLKKVVKDEKRGRQYMVFEYAQQGELFDYIVSHGRLSEKDARRFMRQIVSALEYCHSLLIIHRDLKPENLLLEENYNIKISDFGLSNIMEPGKRFDTFCGSLHYACPEILRGEEYVGPGVDIWSIGIILYCLVVGRQPWDASNAEGLIRAILEEGLEVPSGLSDDCIDLILQMLRVSEYDRLPISKIRVHPWIMEGYGEPPPSYLPPADPITEIDEEIIDNLYEMSFLESNDPDYLATIRKELLSNEKVQLVVVYNLLKQQKEERKLSQETQKLKEDEEDQKLQKKKPENTEKKRPTPSPTSGGTSTTTATSPVSSPTPSSNLPSPNPLNSPGKRKGKKPITITAKGDQIEKKKKINNSCNTTTTPKKGNSAKERIVATGRQRSRTLSNSFDSSPVSKYEKQEESSYSSSEEEEEEGHIPVSPRTTGSTSLKSSIEEQLMMPKEKPVNESLHSRARSASVSPGLARPVIDFDDITSGKITPTKPPKKRAQTPQKTKRPTVLSEGLFNPPMESLDVKEPEPKLNNLSEVQGGMNLIPENTSSKPLEEIVTELLRVLNKEEIQFRKRKNKYIWKCTADVGGETVQVEVEIMNIKIDGKIRGIMVRRIQGSFPHYQELYQKIKQTLVL